MPIKLWLNVQASYTEYRRASQSPGSPWREATPAELAIWEGDNVPNTDPAYRILKDTIIQRIKSAGALDGLMGLYATLTPAQQFEFTQSTWFHSDNALIVGGVQALGLDAATILAPDPLAP